MHGFSKPDINYHIGIYVRQSRDENEEYIETIETQKKLLMEYVRRNNLGVVYKVYVDDNVSGTAFDRNGLNELKKDVLSCNINLVVLKDLSRLGRNNTKTLLFLDFLEEYGCRVLTSDGRYDSLKDNETVGLQSWINESYVRDISRKIRANLRFKIEQGEYIGNAPYGYVKSASEKNKLVVDTRTAPVVREIYEMYKEGHGYAAIAGILNKKGYPSPSSKNSGVPITPWNQVAVQRILCNRVYIGDTVQGISEKISFKNKKTRRLPFDRWVITTNTHESIISPETFEEVQRIRARKRSNQGYNRSVTHALSNLLYCGKCGRAMYVRVRKDRPVGYICSTYGKNGVKECSSHYVPEQHIIDTITNELLEMLSNRDIIDSVNEKYKQNDNTIDDRVNKAIALEQQLQLKQKQQDILYLDRLEGKISAQLFERINKSLETRMTIIRGELEEMKQNELRILDRRNAIADFAERIKKQGINRKIIEMMVNKIVVYDTNDNSVNGNIKTDSTDCQNGMIVIEYNYDNWREA